MIVETFRDAGVPVTEFMVAGGLLKNALLMQIYADVLDLPLSTIDSQQGRRSARPSTPPSRPAPTRTSPPPPRHGPASTAASSSPITDNVAAYDELFAEYRALHDHFGRGGNDVMMRLKAIRRKAVSNGARS